MDPVELKHMELEFVFNAKIDVTPFLMCRSYVQSGGLWYGILCIYLEFQSCRGNTILSSNKLFKKFKEGDVIQKA